jgi:hypothetical protein
MTAIEARAAREIANANDLSIRKTADSLFKEERL